MQRPTLLCCLLAVAWFAVAMSAFAAAVPRHGPVTILKLELAGGTALGGAMGCLARHQVIGACIGLLLSAAVLLISLAWPI